MSIKKIPLSDLLGLLATIYQSGVEYVDIYKIKEEENRDSIEIRWTEKYMQSKPEEQKPENDIPLDEDLNQLI